MNIRDMILAQPEPVLRNSNKYTFDVSMVGQELLQNYLTILYPDVEQEKKITDKTIEKLMIEGIHAKLKKEYKPEELKLNQEFSYDFNENWILTTKIDTVILIKDNTNNTELIIQHNKLAYKYTVDKFLENQSNHNYVKQIIFDKLIAMKSEGMINNIIPKKRIINFFIKDIKNTSLEESFISIDVKNTDNNVFEPKLEIKLLELQEAIESGDIPPVCTDLWWKDVEGKNIPTKCSHYCTQSKNCPYYDNAKQQIKEL